MATANIGGIPVFDAKITDSDTGMFIISLVDSPAVESDFLSFDQTKVIQQYRVENEDRRLVRGVVMRADFPIYRRTEGMGEYYIIFRPEQIRIMAEKYLSESRQNNVNLMHQAGSDVEGVQMVQYFIKGDGVSVEGFDDIADGSLFAEFHITNDDVWKAVCDGTYKGFSLEGYFEMVPSEEEIEVEEDSFSKIINNIFTMTKIERLKSALRKALEAEFFSSITTDKGILVWESDEDLKEGDQVSIEDLEGNRTPATDGDYKTEDGKTIKVVDGKVAEIVDPEAEVAVEEPAVAEAEETEAEEAAEGGIIKTDKGDLHHKGAELKEGDDVFVIDAEGNEAPAGDGDYTTEDGKVIKVAEGKVTEIVDDQAEVAPESEEMTALRAENEALKAEIESLKAEVVRLSEMPLAAAAHEEVTTSGEFKKTGVKGLDRLQQILRA